MTHATVTNIELEPGAQAVRRLHVRSLAGRRATVAGLNSLRPGPQILSLDKVRELFHPDWTVHEPRLAGISARFGLREGFRHTVSWYRTHGWL